MKIARAASLWGVCLVLAAFVFAGGCPQSSSDSETFRVKTSSEQASSVSSQTADGTATAAQSASGSGLSQQVGVPTPERAGQPQQSPGAAPTSRSEVSRPAAHEGELAASKEATPTPQPVSLQATQVTEVSPSRPVSPPPAPHPAIDLLSLVNPTDHSLRGQWLREEKGLCSPGQPYTTLVFPFEPPSEYRLEIMARRVEGSESLNVTLPMGNSQAMAVLDGFGRRISGLSLVSGRTADANETRHFGFGFQNNSSVCLEFFCSPNRLAVRAADRWIIDWRGDPSVLSLDTRYWSHIPRGRICISVYSATTVFVIERANLTPCPEGLGLPEEPLVQRVPGPSFAGAPGTRPPFAPPPWLRSTEPPPQAPRGQDQASAPSPHPVEVPSASEAPASSVVHFNEEPPEAVTQWKDSVGLIEYPLASGTGFVLKENLVVTNAHVIEAAFAEDMVISFAGAQEGRYRVQKILFEDPARDLAVLQVTCPQKPIPLAQQSDLRTGDKVAIISNPSLGKTDVVLRNAIVAGQVAARVHTKGYDFYQVNANVNPGSSGAPLFNWQGKVVGVIAMKATEQGERELGTALRNLDQTFAKMMPGVIRRGIAFAIPGNVLVKACEEAEKELQQPTGRASDLHTERAMFEKLALAGALYLLKFAANVPDEVREQERLVRMRGVPRMAASKVKLVDLLPEYQADKINDMLNGSEGREILTFCTRDLNQRLEALKQSPHADAERVKLLEALFRTVSTLRRNSENPPTTYQAYSQVALQQSENLKNQVTKLIELFSQFQPAYAD